MLCGLLTVQQATIGDCLAFDPFPLDENGLTPPEVGVGWRQVVDGLVISQMIIVGDEGLDLGFEIAGQVIVLEQDVIFQRLMPALDLPQEEKTTDAALTQLAVTVIYYKADAA
jgi:hypothetical protein